MLNDRLNLIVLWSAVLWSVGLRGLDGGSLRPWHMALPVACIAGAGIVTWALGPMAYGAILRLG